MKKLNDELAGLRLCFSFMGRHRIAYWLLVLSNFGIDYIAKIGLALLTKNATNSVLMNQPENFKGILIFAGVVVFLYALKSVSGYGKMYCVRQIMLDLRVNLFAHMEQLTVDYFEKNHSGDSIFRLNSNVETMKRAYTMYSNNIIGGLGGGIISCIFILILDWKLGLISIAACALTVTVNMLFAPKLRRLGKQIQNAESALAARLSDMLAGIRIIKLYRSGETATERYKMQSKITADTRITRIRVSSWNEAVNQFMNFVDNFVIITIGALMSAKGISDLGTVLAILSIQGNVSDLFMGFGSAWGMMQESISAAEMIRDVFDTQPEKQKRESDGSADSDKVIELRDVSFSYDKEHPVLNGVSLTVKQGETAALAGNSGGGKSTIIKLIPEFYQIQSGAVYLLGKNIRNYRLSELRSKIAYVPQDSYLFEESILENIRFGRPEASDDEVMAAAKMANAHEFITALPDGYDTITGERGETLSGGQRQRIAIARAFLKDAPVLLLDEATSALDNENEQLVQQSLEQLMKNRTTLVVAHRLSTIKNADVIYVIRDGRVVQQGTHEELSADEGVYHELVQLSAEQ